MRGTSAIPKPRRPALSSLDAYAPKNVRFSGQVKRKFASMYGECRVHVSGAVSHQLLPQEYRCRTGNLNVRLWFLWDPLMTPRLILIVCSTAIDDTVWAKKKGNHKYGGCQRWMQPLNRKRVKGTGSKMERSASMTRTCHVRFLLATLMSCCTSYVLYGIQSR